MNRFYRPMALVIALGLGIGQLASVSPMANYSMRPSTAYADEPIITGLVIAAGAALFAWALRGGKKDCVTVTEKWTDENGHEHTITHEKCANNFLIASHEGRSALAQGPSILPITIMVPHDVPATPLPPSYVMAESTTRESRSNYQGDISIRDFHYEANAQNTAFSSQPTPFVSFSTIRRTNFVFEKPPTIPPAVVSTATLSINVSGLTISTVDSPKTVGSAGYELNINSPEMGNLFTSSVHVPQGGVPVIAGNIPLSSFIVTSGKAILNQYSKEITVIIPSGLTQVTFIVELHTSGEGKVVQFGPRFCSFIRSLVPSSAINSALANPDQIDGWNKLRNPGVLESFYNTRRKWLSLRSLAVPYHPIFNGLVFKSYCP